MPTDPFTMLESDHRQVARMLQTLADSEPGAEREELVRQLTLAFEVHAQFEETAVYPLVTEVMGSETETEAEVEHGLAREGLAKLSELVAAPGFGAAVEMLEGGITHHVDEEEGEIFPELRRAVDQRTQARLASELGAAKASSGLPIVDPESATKDELLRAAADAGIEGRSSMTKAQLAEALARSGS
jgi:hemerythrin-like domain-containing protein